MTNRAFVAPTISHSTRTDHRLALAIGVVLSNLIATAEGSTTCSRASQSLRACRLASDQPPFDLWGRVIEENTSSLFIDSRGTPIQP